MQPCKAAFLDLTIALERLPAARLQLANGRAQVQQGEPSATGIAVNLCRQADDLHNQFAELIDDVRRAWIERDDR